MLEQSAKEHHIGFSRTVRLIIDFALDQDPDLGLPILIDERNAVRAQLAALDASITDLEAKKKTRKTETPRTVFEEVTIPVTSESSKASPKAPFTDKRHAETEHERWQKKLPYLFNPKGLQKEQQEKVMETVLNETAAHPDWVDGETGETKDMLLRLLDAEKRRRRS